MAVCSSDYRPQTRPSALNSCLRDSGIPMEEGVDALFSQKGSNEHIFLVLISSCILVCVVNLK